MKVSVLMLAYNHERYISSALESALCQRTDFLFEIVVGEDCSTDRTREILIGYRDRHPDRVRLLLPERNLGMMENLVQTFQACRGEYVAMLEGDDYWTSPDKLQRQVDFLDGHPGCAECFHNVDIIEDGRPGERRPFVGKKAKLSYSLRDVAYHNIIPTCAIMFRRKLIPSFPDWFSSMPMGDWPMQVLLAEHGTITYLPDNMGAYRVHSGGAWSGSSRISILEKSLRAADVINRHLEFRFDRVIRKNMGGWQREIAKLQQKQGAHRLALQHAWRAVALSPLRNCWFLARTAVRAAVGALL